MCPDTLPITAALIAGKGWMEMDAELMGNVLKKRTKKKALYEGGGCVWRRLLLLHQ
ncbi:hypothetical protein [Bartonella phoceensis]|uniref:hypothetical protein n=1 Tax=Bartonella phoceensis TaxID=270249 RepID=UPI001ABA4AD3|nr:hypothetical protein [Bartonella phoceensis]